MDCVSCEEKLRVFRFAPLCETQQANLTMRLLMDNYFFDKGGMGNTSRYTDGDAKFPL